MPDDVELTRFGPEIEVNGNRKNSFETPRCGSSKREMRKVKRPFFVPALFAYEAEIEDDDDSIVKVFGVYQSSLSMNRFILSYLGFSGYSSHWKFQTRVFLLKLSPHFSLSSLSSAACSTCCLPCPK